MRKVDRSQELTGTDRGRAQRLTPPKRLLLMTLSALLLSLSYAPFGQAYLAWIGLVPWLIAIRPCRSMFTAFLWGWLGGSLFFAANIWWLWTATLQGMVVLILFLASYWGLAASLLQLLGVFSPNDNIANPPAGAVALSQQPRGSWRTQRQGLRLAFLVLTIAIVWTGIEWFRATSVDPRGFLWMFLGYSQGTFPLGCQVADFGGVFAVSFWVALINGLGWVGFDHARNLYQSSAIGPTGSQSHLDSATGLGRWSPLLLATMLVGVIFVGVIVYGWYRLAEEATVPGPRVTVVQPDHPHLPGGDRTASREEALRFHVDATRRALREEPTDLIVWSETVLPPLNAEARAALQAGEGGRFMEYAHQQASTLAREARAWLVTGANHVGGWRHEGRATVGTEIRNSAYLYSPEGEQTARYDKSQLAAFSERVPFRDRVNWLYRLMFWLSPPVASQPLVAGDAQSPVIFSMTGSGAGADGPTSSMPVGTRPAGRAFRFVAPICLENTFPAYVAQLVAPDASGHKRADFIVNLSNDGWFAAMEKYQHLYNVAFRCIENRVPQARASNTGISAFIDSCGRVVRSLPPDTEGTLTHRIMLDRRIAPYARWGETFAIGCVLLIGVLILGGPVRHRLTRRKG